MNKKWIIPITIAVALILFFMADRSESPPPKVDNAAPSNSCSNRTLRTWEKEIRFLPHVQDGVVEGWMIRNLKPESAWAKAGFEEGDAIYAFDGKTPLNPDEFYSKLADVCRPGVTLTYVHHGQMHQRPSDEIFKFLEQK